jgi:DNA (cytosine-5)-methyltransferase 1
MSRTFNAKRFVGVDLFSGAGGMTLGAKLAGVTVLAAVENDPHAIATYEANHEEIKLWDADVHDWHEFPETCPEDVKILFGGAPCQGFSTSKGQASQPHYYV